MTFLAAALPLISTIGAGISAGSSVVSGIAQGNAASYQAQVARNNATIADRNAAYSIAAGQQATETQSKKGAAQIGEIKTSQAASGIDVNSGSAVDVQAGQRATNKLDTENVLSDAQLKAYGYTTQAQSFTSQAGLDEATAEQAPIGGILSGIGSLASNASSLSTKWGSGTAGAVSTGTSWSQSNDTNQAG